MRRLVQKRWFVIMLMAFVTFHLSLTPSFSAVQQQKKTAVKKTGKSKKSGKTGKKQTSVSKKKNASKQPSGVNLAAGTTYCVVPQPSRSPVSDGSIK